MKNCNTTCGGYVFTTSSDIPVWDGTLPDDLADINVFVILE